MTNCPFCNSPLARVTTDKREDKGRYYYNSYVKCGTCKARGPVVTTGPDDAENAWNKRR